MNRAYAVLWLGNLHFAPGLDPARYKLSRLDARGLSPLTFERARALANATPDLFFASDASLPPLLLDPERVPVGSVFYSVDSHIHGWHPVYARAFDLVVHAQKDAAAAFLAAGVPANRLLWLPLFSRPGDAPGSADKIHDVMFVGTVDPATTPVRSRFLSELAKLVPGLTVTSGDYRQLYPQAKIVLNVAERGDLNFRVFEALACGACLLTPTVANGQDELFTPGEDFAVYAHNDPVSAAREITRLLSNDAERERLAARGLAASAVHTAEVRAARFADWLTGFDLAALAAERQNNAQAIFDGALKLLLLHWAENHHDPAWRSAYLKAARR